MLMMLLGRRHGGCDIPFASKLARISSQTTSTSFAKSSRVPTKRSWRLRSSREYASVGRETTKCARMSGSRMSVVSSSRAVGAGGAGDASEEEGSARAAAAVVAAAPPPPTSIQRNACLRFRSAARPVLPGATATFALDVDPEMLPPPLPLHSEPSLTYPSATCEDAAAGRRE